MVSIHHTAVLFSIFGIHILDVSFVHMRSMRLWHRLAVTGDIKKIPMNWDDCMLEDCQPSVLMSATCLSEYQARCPVQDAPACETLMEQDGDFDMRADTEEGSDVDDCEFRQQGRNLVLQMLAACGRDQEMKRKVLDHLEMVVQDVQLMAAEPSGNTRESVPLVKECTVEKVS